MSPKLRLGDITRASPDITNIEPLLKISEVHVASICIYVQRKKGNVGRRPHKEQ
jgi:hypothetical protein